MGAKFVTILFAIAMAAGGMLVAQTAGTPLLPALIALLAGGAAIGLLTRGGDHTPAPEATPENDERPLQPSAADLLAGIDDPLLIVRERRVLLANPAAREVLGEHIEGVDIRLAIRHPAAAERLTNESGENEEGISRTELVGLGERERRWEMAMARLPDGARLVRLIDRSKEHAAERMRVDFVANASHELRTPLANLLGYLETLEDPKAADDAKLRTRFLGIMLEEAKRMQRLVEDLMSLSRIEAERFSTPRDKVDLVALGEELKRDLAGSLEGADANLLIDCRIDEACVYGDGPQLRQLIHNLVMNALKYGRKGEDITLRFDNAGAEMLRMTVIDRGDGIAPEHLPRLTERFYRVDPGRSRAVGGTGLGLAIVKHIVSRHRGRLDIRSRPGQGTAVHIYLPKVPEALS
jgi:two-component system, OmpR family, phosphate regulon sensor histidine kinase PhoR